jgi:hypothetical protein
MPFSAESKRSHLDSSDNETQIQKKRRVFDSDNDDDVNAGILENEESGKNRVRAMIDDED